VGGYVPSAAVEQIPFEFALHQNCYFFAFPLLFTFVVTLLAPAEAIRTSPIMA
jgi:ABC-type lipoprotein release transport system permease subunit